MDGSAGAGGEQQFCLRWNNFQANITSQFEALRDDEELVDVTLAVEGQRLEAHKVVLSACSPYFKDLFKNNPCPHPIIFMRDCEAAHVRALLQFMYAGQVNIAQAQLSAFLRTADALQIRGLTDSSAHSDKRTSRKSPPSQLRNLLSAKPSNSTSKAACQNTDSSSEAAGAGAGAGTGAGSAHPRRRSLRSSADDAAYHTSQPRLNSDEFGEANSYPAIRVKTDLERPKVEDVEMCGAEEAAEAAEAAEAEGDAGVDGELLEPKLEVVEREYDASDEERAAFPHMYYHENNALANPFAALAAHGNIDLLAGLNNELQGGDNLEVKWGARRARPVPDAVWLEQHRRELPFAFKRENAPSSAAAPKLIKLGEGVEVREELLRGVKWGDYRKVTRGLAAALFSPAELATCSVTGQRWSRAGQESRPTKPPLDRRRVHALISYVSRHFPDVEVSRIKQVLAYKCKENCAALRMRTASESTNFLLGAGAAGAGAGGAAARAMPPDASASAAAARSYTHFDAKSFLLESAAGAAAGGGADAEDGGGCGGGGGGGGGGGATPAPH